MLNKKNSISLIALAFIFISCGGGKSSPESIAKKWCDLNSKVYKASNDEERQSARADLKKYENEIEKKYESDEAFMKKVEVEAEKCEGASEGR